MVGVYFLSILLSFSAVQMVRHYQRKTKWGQATGDQYQAAAFAILNGSSIRAAAKAHGLSNVTLRRYLKKKESGQIVSCPKYSTHRKVFSAENEHVLVEYLHECSDKQYGLTLKEACQLVYQYAVKQGIDRPPSWDRNQSAGNEWMLSFRKRHNLPLRVARNSTISFNKPVEDKFFNLLEIDVADIQHQTPTLSSEQRKTVDQARQKNHDDAQEQMLSLAYEDLCENDGENLQLVKVEVADVEQQTPPLSNNQSKMMDQATQSNHVDAQEEILSMVYKHLSEPENENLQLTKVWARELSKMDPQQQIFAKKGINDIIFEGQMGTLKRNSIQINAVPCETCKSLTVIHHPSHS